jgi:hypothetical protein
MLKCGGHEAIHGKDVRIQANQICLFSAVSAFGYPPNLSRPELRQGSIHAGDSFSASFSPLEPTSNQSDLCRFGEEPCQRVTRPPILDIQERQAARMANAPTQTRSQLEKIRFLVNWQRHLKRLVKILLAICTPECFILGCRKTGLDTAAPKKNLRRVK